MKKIYYKKQDGSTGQVSPYIININSDRIPESIFGLSRIREFSEAYPYKEGSLFMKDDILYRAIESHLGKFGTGSWCTITSLYSEILKMAESDYMNKTITMTEQMWDAIESSPYALAEFLRDYTGYTLDVIEDYDETDISTDNYIIGGRLVLAGVIQVEGRLIGLTGTVVNGILTISVVNKGDIEPGGDDTHEFDGGVVNGVLGPVISNVSGSGVLGPIIGSVSSSGVLSIFGSSGGGGGSGGGGEVTGDVLKVTGSVSSTGTLSVTGVVRDGTLSVSGSSTPGGGGGGSNVPIGNATGVYGDVLRLNGSTKIEGTVVNNTLNITI